MFGSSTKSANVADGFGYNFDIVIAQLHLTNVNIEDNSKLTIDVKFNNNSIKITSSRINVHEFKPERSFEFKERLPVLREKLLKTPLECHVYYDSQLVGICTFLWPSSFINCIDEEYGRELRQCDETDIENENQKVGRMEIIARLQIKCPEFEEKKVLQPKINLCESVDNVINVINPNDVLFAVSATKCGSIACSDIDVIPASEPELSALATCLDLSDLRHIHGKTVKSTDILDSIEARCCKKKNSSIPCKEIIKNLLEKSFEKPSCSKSNSKEQLYQLRGKLQVKQRDCISEIKFSSSSTDSYQPFYCISDENASEDLNIRRKCGLKENATKRYCPLCHDNITWLPKFAACPKCGFRPFSHNIEEKPYDYTLTANDILQEYADGNVMDRASNHSMKKSRQTGSCRCTCKNGKLCAHCRIKQLCEDIFQSNRKLEEDCGKCETKSSDLYNICKTSSRSCRPYLTKVFEELKNLFDMNDTKKINVVENNELNNISQNVAGINSADLQVNQSLEVNKNRNEAQKSHQSPEKKLDEQRKQILSKNFEKHDGFQNKSFDYNNKHHKYPSSKIGHKTCLAGLKIVPRNMGWLWNAETNGSRSGWMPGAIRKPIKNLMQHFLNKDKLYSSCNWKVDEDSHNEEKDYTKEPTLHICKKHGVYYITLRPQKSICIEPYLNLKPIQFQITKNPFLIKLRKIKQHLKEMGFAKCICHKPISNCCCRSFLEKKKLEYQCCKECHKRDLPNCCGNLILSDTTDSEAEFEFGVTPPAGVVQPGTCFKKRKKVSSGTQYEEGDWQIKPKYPKPLGKYLKLHNCAVGNRFGKAFGPYGMKGYSPGGAPVAGIYGPGGMMQLRKQGKNARNVAIRGPEAFRGPDGKFSMAKYLAYKQLLKPSKEEIAKRKRHKMKLLKGVNPPLLCKVDRRRKPIDICSAYLPCNSACLNDDRIC